MSLSSQPSFDILRNEFVCGYRDIENSSHAGSSRKHMPGGQSIETSNGSGPHNIQIFVLTPDGIVLTCLPGYWRSDDLARELDFAKDLYKVWQDPMLSLAQKKATFSQMQLGHIAQHPKDEKARSHMQGFDIAYEKEHRLGTSDVFYRNAINPTTREVPNNAVKTTDVIMHERMAARPFVAYKNFDWPEFSDYGKPMYDKEEDFRLSDGQIAPGANISDAPMIGNDPRAHPIKTEVKRQGKSVFRAAVTNAMRFGINAAIH